MKRLIIVIIAIISIAVMLLALGVFQGNQYRLKNGDYVIYSIKGIADGSLHGTERDYIYSVNSAGYEVSVTYTGVYLRPYTYHISWNEDPRVQLSFNDTETIQTIWGLKSVDKYSQTISSGTGYYFFGHETGYGMYRMDVLSGSNSETWEITSTSIAYYSLMNNA